MRQIQPTRVRSKLLAAGFGFVFTAIWIVSFTPAAAIAEPPATVASCDGIGDAYPILGRKCDSAYGKIDHAPDSAKKRLKSYRARIAVMKIFRQALICNGYFGANSNAQRRFRSEENGHLRAIANLHQAMGNAGDSDVPDLFTANDLKRVKMKKRQCK